MISPVKHKGYTSVNAWIKLCPLLLLALTACTQPTAAPSATLLPPTRTQPTPSDTVTPSPVPLTATRTPWLAGVQVLMNNQTARFYPCALIAKGPT